MRIQKWKQIALNEAFRVLKRGGRAMVLEFSHIQGNPLLQKIYDEYSFQIIPRIGGLVAGDEASYKYLVESIRRFPEQVNMCVVCSRLSVFNLGF